MAKLSKELKDRIRMRVWKLMEKSGVAMFPKPIMGRIPNFLGAEKTADLLRSLPEYEGAGTIFCNPDSPQRPVREMALRDGKRVVMATPRMRKGFILLDPAALPKNRLSEAASIRGAFKFGQFIEPSKVKVDLFIAGSVAVSVDGVRLGKGTGYSDQEYALLKLSGALTPDVPIITTVHDLQLVENIPKESWDVPVNVIITPTRVLRVEAEKRVRP